MVTHHTPAARRGVPRLMETARGPVEVARTGSGPALLALHGGMGGFDQGLLLARAACAGPEGFDVIAPSRPGYLGTPLAGRESPEAQADLYAALLDELGLARTLVAAVSAGGPGALAFAARHPERCAGVVLVSACTRRLHVPERVRARLPVMRVVARVPGLPAFMEWMTRRQPMRAARASILDAAECARTLADPEAGPLMRALQESVLRDMGRRLPGTQVDVDQLTRLPEAPPWRVSVPVLAIHGTGDRVVPFDHTERLQAALPATELLRIEGGEHVCLFTHMAAVRAAVAGFLARLPLEEPASA
ncbi:alpha/beta hydrolase [Xanthobacter sp. V3C-3]|uniref:alpha/beta fold hydrolase n=1 Tax=Xanthobacter lutulentifluminis TaxID=3119935 RepID=UPI0037293150